MMQKGFTLVELLIVIVVIAILAAIAVSSFNTVQTKARNAQTISTVKSYRDALLAYGGQSGVYPIPAGQSACLGEGYPAGCWGGTNNSTFNDAIRPYMSNANPLPLPNTKPITYGISVRTGAAYNYLSTATYDGVSYPWGIVYMIEGNELCGLPDVMTPAVGSQWPNFSSNPDPAKKGYSARQTSNTACRIMLPDPTTL